VKNRAPGHAVTDAEKSFQEPFTAEEAPREAKKRHPGIGRVSGYRTR